MLDDKMRAGYELLTSGSTVAACQIWLDAWNDVAGILDRTGMKPISAFDKRFRGSEALFNWIQNLESELGNAGQEDRQFLITRITVCEEGLRRFQTRG